MRRLNRFTIVFLTCLLLMMAILPITRIAFARFADDGLISFSQIKVKAKGHDGWLLGRSVQIKIVGTVTNNTSAYIDEDDLPILECTSSSEDSIMPKLKEKELAPQEKCQVRYEGDVYFDDSDVPALAFAGSSEYTGLRDAQKELDNQLASIKGEFQETDEKAAEEKAEREAKKAEEEKTKAEARERILACEGKTAGEAFETVRELEYSFTFKDSYDVNVTKDVENSEADSTVREAIVTRVDASDGWLFGGPSATFVLDYTDPAAKKEREEKEAKSKRQQDAADALESCAGVTSLESLKLADEAGYETTYYDSYKVNVTDDVHTAESGSEIAEAIVTDVEIDSGWLFIGPSAKITLDYIDPQAAKEREEEEKRRQEEERQRQERELKRKNFAIIHDCVGKSAGKSQEKVDGMGYRLRINDSKGVKITDDVRNAEKGSPIRRAKVTGVEIREKNQPPIAIFTIDYLSAASRNKINRDEGYPSEVTITDTNVLVEDSDPVAKNPKYYITVTGTITNDNDWAVKAYYLPALGGVDYSFRSCAEIDLDGYVGHLEPRETRGFKYFIYTTNASETFVLKTENNDAVIHGAQEISDEIGRQLPIVKETHDANVDYLREEQRKNRTCYYTDSGYCYHMNDNCPALSRSRNIYSTTVGNAETWLEPCDRCYWQ